MADEMNVGNSNRPVALFSQTPIFWILVVRNGRLDFSKVIETALSREVFEVKIAVLTFRG